MGGEEIHLAPSAARIRPKTENILLACDGREH